MEHTGVVFEIKQMALFDGPGIRTTVFMKGCPLRCQWCHNPEGLSPEPQLMVSHNNYLGCNKCKKVCKHKDGCILCGECIKVCPNNLRRICGEKYTSSQLAEVLLRDKDYLIGQGGGITFSGGEPTMQGKFILETIDKLENLHCAIETSGYCDKTLFRELIKKLDYIIMDIKIVDDEKHHYYTGVSNVKILENLEELKRSGKPFMIRIPVIPGVNDTDENFLATAQLLTNVPSLEKVELLPYHKTAGAKYAMVGKAYKPDFDIQKSPHLNNKIFHEYGITCINV